MYTEQDAKDDARKHKEERRDERLRQYDIELAKKLQINWLVARKELNEHMVDELEVGVRIHKITLKIRPDKGDVIAVVSGVLGGKPVVGFHSAEAASSALEGAISKAAHNLGAFTEDKYNEVLPDGTVIKANEGPKDKKVARGRKGPVVQQELFPLP